MNMAFIHERLTRLRALVPSAALLQFAVSTLEDY